MSVVILNITGNRDGFEDRLAEDLRRGLAASAHPIAARGAQLLSLGKPMEGHRAVVVIAHGCRKGSRAVLDTGLQHAAPAVPGSEWLQSTEVLFDALGCNSVEYVAVLCICSSLARDTIAGAIKDHNCLGTVGSHNPVGVSHLGAVTALVDALHSAVVSGTRDAASFLALLSKWRKGFPDQPGFYFSPGSPVEKES
jgi:hypothetical protein